MEKDELFALLDSSLVNVNYDENRDNSFRRFFYTWNNPFFNDDFEEVDINNTEYPLDLEHYDLHNLKTEFNKEFFEFKYVKYEDYRTHELKVIERPFFKDVNSIRNYITNFHTFRYSCFQIEKGGNSETVHIQGFVTFKNPMHWTTFKNNFPCAHFNKCLANNLYCKQYCSKEETRIEGPFEDGEFAEERSRTDIKQFLDLIKLGANDDELQEFSPKLYLDSFNKIEEIKLKSVFKEYKTKWRKIDVTYIYGPPRTGKTSYVAKKYGYGKFYYVSAYNRGPFDNYSGEKIIVFDEFESQFDLSQFNMILDGHPVQLPCRYKNRWACYDKVYIISNSPLSEQYNKDYIKPVQREAFLSRISNIIRFDSSGQMHYEKRTNNNVQLELIDNSEVEDIFI